MAARQVRAGWPWLAIGGASLVTGLLVAHLPSVSSSFTAPGIYAIIALIAGVTPIARRVMTGTFDVFEPVVGGSAMLISLFAVRPLVMLGTGDFTYQHTIDVHSEFTRATLIGALATVSLVVGYEILVFTRRTPAARLPPAPLSIDLTWRVALVMVMLGVAIFLLRLAVSGNPLTTLETLTQGLNLASADTNVSAYLDDGPLLAACAAVIAVIAVHGRPQPKERLILIALVVGPAAAFYLLGNRRMMLPSVLTPMIAYYLVRARRPRWRTLAILVPVAFVILATIPFERLSGARQNNRGGALGIFEQSFKAPFKPVGDFFNGSDTQMVPDLGLEIAVLRRPSDYYFGGATIGDVLLSPVPTALIPGKPITARNSLLVRIFGAPCGVVGGSQCPDFSAAGTFYQDFWLVGVVGGMLVLGAFSAALWQRFRESPQSPMAVVLAASWVVSLPILIRAGFMPAFQWWLEFVVPSYFAVRFISGSVVPNV